MLHSIPIVWSPFGRKRSFLEHSSALFPISPAAASRAGLFPWISPRERSAPCTEPIAAGAGPRGLYLQFGALLHHPLIKLTLTLPGVPWGKRARKKPYMV